MPFWPLPAPLLPLCWWLLLATACAAVASLLVARAVSSWPLLSTHLHLSVPPPGDCYRGAPMRRRSPPGGMAAGAAVATVATSRWDNCCWRGCCHIRASRLLAPQLPRSRRRWWRQPWHKVVGALLDFGRGPRLASRWSLGIGLLALAGFQHGLQRRGLACTGVGRHLVWSHYCSTTDGLAVPLSGVCSHLLRHRLACNGTDCLWQARGMQLCATGVQRHCLALAGKQCIIALDVTYTSTPVSWLCRLRCRISVVRAH